MSNDDLPELNALAEDLGVQTGYWDTKGDRHTATPEALRGVLRAWGIDLADGHGYDELRHQVMDRATRCLQPVVVVWAGAPLRFTVCVPEHRGGSSARIEVAFEHGGEQYWNLDLDSCPVSGQRLFDGRSFTYRSVELGGALAEGYHELQVELAGSRHRSTLLVAPTTVVDPGRQEYRWGVFAPLYSLRTELGIGPHLGDLGALGAWLHRSGASVVATLPLLATFLDAPFDPSPYTPVSRCFWNDLYVDLERCPELAGSPQARELLDSPETQGEIAALRSEPDFDYARQARLTDALLSELAASFFGADETHDDYERLLVDRPEVLDYARFRAAVDRRGAGWHSWPATQRSGVLSPADYDEDRLQRHLFGQFAVERQMNDLSGSLSGRGQGLYLDLPVGSHSDGYDTWRNQDLFAWGAGTGAPPDDFFTEGQNWGFPPMLPTASRDDGHRFFVECVRHHMRSAGILRLDHVMQLHRLFWVPDGMPASEGVYVHYPREELMAVLAIESHRHECVVVGEDLGTVPDEVRDAMDAHELLSMYVAQFQIDDRPGAELAPPPRRSLASVNTHDTPTFAGFLRGLDIGRRHELGLLSDDDAAGEHAARRQQIANLVAHLARQGLLDEPGGEHEILRGLLALLGSSEAATVLVSFEDLWGQTNPQNIPGTPVDRPNWVQKFPSSLADLAEDGRLHEDLAVVQRARQAALAGSGEASR